MTLKTGKKIITIHTLYNISRGSGNQTMKSYKNVVEKLLPDPFLQNQV